MIFYFPTFLTLIRIFLAPIFLIFLFWGGNYLFYSLLIFTLAALTDFGDGYVARKYNVVTKSGGFLDPLADKVLISSAFLGFYFLGITTLWVPILIITRDVLITVLRTVILTQGYSLKTSVQAKGKTGFQFFVIYLIFIFLILDFKVGSSAISFWMSLGTNIAIYFVVGFTL